MHHTTSKGVATLLYLLHRLSGRAPARRRPPRCRPRRPRPPRRQSWRAAGPRGSRGSKGRAPLPQTAPAAPPARRRPAPRRPAAADAAPAARTRRLRRNAGRGATARAMRARRGRAAPAPARRGIGLEYTRYTLSHPTLNLAGGARAPAASSSSCVPRSAMAPPSTTATSAADCTVDRRCAMTMTVRPTATRSSASCTSDSLSASSALVACRPGARAALSARRCPPDLQAAGRPQSGGRSQSASAHSGAAPPDAQQLVLRLQRRWQPADHYTHQLWQAT